MGKDFRIQCDGRSLVTPYVPRHLPCHLDFTCTLAQLRETIRSMDINEPEYILYALAYYVISIDGRDDEVSTYQITYD
jgi:hypothetical protein